MSTRRTVRLATVAAALAASAAVILLNLALLGYAQPRNDPVGNLSPRAALVPAPASRPAPVPRHDHEHDDEADD